LLARRLAVASNLSISTLLTGQSFAVSWASATSASLRAVLEGIRAHVAEGQHVFVSQIPRGGVDVSRAFRVDVSLILRLNLLWCCIYLGRSKGANGEGIASTAVWRILRRFVDACYEIHRGVIPEMISYPFDLIQKPLILMAKDHGYYGGFGKRSSATGAIILLLFSAYVPKC
jgi:hypothetical protein